MTHRNLLPVLLLVVLCACNNKHTDPVNLIKVDFKPSLDLPLGSSIHPVSVIGEWSYSFPFYSSELTINGDGTFRFHSQGCMGHGYSEGRWSSSGTDISLSSHGTDISLTSFKKYAQPAWSQKIIKIDTIASAKMRMKKATRKPGSMEKVSFMASDFIYEIDMPDTANVYYNNQQLQLKGDTLYMLDQAGLRTNEKFIMTKQGVLNK